jgi:tetratricopeptide (TPR) repeat protein
VVSSLLDVGALERDLGQVEAALVLLEEGRALAREIGERLFECSLAIEIGDCHLDAGQPREALREFLVAKEIARQFGAKLLMSEGARGAAEAELALGDALRAGDEARSAYDIAQRIGAPPLVGAALRVAAASVGMGAAGESDLGGAREMFDRAVEVLSNAGAELELGRTLAAYADYEQRNGRRQAADELRRQSLLIIARARQGRASVDARRSGPPAIAWPPPPS